MQFSHQAALVRVCPRKDVEVHRLRCASSEREAARRRPPMSFPDCWLYLSPRRRNGVGRLSRRALLSQVWAAKQLRVFKPHLLSAAPSTQKAPLLNLTGDDTGR